jgi:RTX calcium-binding nonapeptide repeat (4 copies)
VDRLRRRRDLGSVILVVGVLLGLLAAPASASTAQLIDVLLPAECKDIPPGGSCTPEAVKTLVYQAAPGEANVVRLTGRTEVHISDRAAVIEPGEGCSRIDRHNVSCSASEAELYGVFVAAGGGGDSVTSRLDTGGTWFDERVILDGGPGNDVLVGGPTWDQLYGGKGADVLRGRGGDDRLYDASPQDPLRSGAPSPFGEAVVPLANPGPWRDSFDGGRGQRDSISYETRVADITVDLANPAAVGGTRREPDSVRGVENALGGAGDDLLAGNRQNNGLYGAEGDDRIVGRQGSDLIEGGSGNNVIIGGPGNDQINANYRSTDYGAERIFCGSGRDIASWLFPNDFLHDDCEEMYFNFFTVGAVYLGGPRSELPLRKGRPPTVLSATLWCLPGRDCDLTFELRVLGPGARRGTSPPEGTLLGSQSYTFSGLEQRNVSLDVSPAGLEILRRHRKLRVVVTITEDPAQPPVGYQTVLRAP